MTSLTKIAENTLPEQFNDWIAGEHNLEPITLSPERIQQLSNPPYCMQELSKNSNTSLVRLLPQYPQDVADFLNLTRQHKQTVSVNVPSNDTNIVLEITQLKHIQAIHLEDTAVTVETGIQWGELQRILGQHGKWIPLTYPAKTLLLDILKNDTPSLDTGSPNYPGGYIRDYVMGVELATSDGRLNKYGGLVVKNATGYDLNKLYVGSHYHFGILTSITLKIFQKPSGRFTYRIPFSRSEHIWPLMENLEKSSIPFQWYELVLCLNQTQQSVLLLQITSHYHDLLEQYQHQLKQLVSECNLNLEPIETDIIFSQLPENPDYTKVDMSYPKLGKKFHKTNEAEWLTAIKEELKDCLPDWITFRPMASIGKLVWENSAKLRNNANETAQSIFALDKLLQGNNPYGISEGFLELHGLETNCDYLYQALKTIYDPTHVLS